MRVLRLCSVFEPPPEALSGRGVRFDPMGGMQNHTAQLSRTLDSLHVKQTIVTTRPPGAANECAFGGNGRLIRFGVATPVARQLYWLPAWQCLPDLAEQADLIHAHLGEDLAIVPLALRASRRARIPFVLTVHCSLRHTIRVTGPRSALLRSLGAGLERYGVRRAAAVIVLTERARGLLMNGGVPAERVHVVPSGIGPEFRHLRRVPDPLAHIPRPRLIYAGRLHAQKGVDVLVRAAAVLGQPKAHLAIVGDGPERARLERLAARLGLSGRVHFLGFLPHELMPAVLAGADVVVLPSRYEELGTVLVEAMAAAAPIVASRAGGIPELIVDGETGLLVPPDRPGELAAAIGKVLRDPRLAGALGTRGRHHVEQLRWDRLVHRVLDVYQRVLTGDAS